MRAFAFQGTPTAILIDAQGRRRRQVFGVHDDLLLGSEIGTLLAEMEQQRLEATGAAPATGHCTDGRCELGAGAAARNPLP
jgi:hypothetical protein